MRHGRLSKPCADRLAAGARALEVAKAETIVVLSMKAPALLYEAMPKSFERSCVLNVWIGEIGEDSRCFMIRVGLALRLEIYVA